MPLALTLGGQDTVVPPDSVRSLAQKLQARNKHDALLLDRPDVGHETHYDDCMQAYTFVLDQANKASLSPP